MEKLHVNSNEGIPIESKIDHNARISAFGINEFPSPKMKSCFYFVKE